MLIDFSLSTFWLWKKIKQNSDEGGSHVGKFQEYIYIGNVIKKQYFHNISY